MPSRNFFAVTAMIHTALRAIVLCLVSLALGVGSLAPSLAQAKSNELSTLKKNVSSQKKQANKLRSQAQKLSQQEKRLHKDLAKLEHTLKSLRNSVAAKEKDLDTTESQLARTQMQREKTEQSIAEAEKALGKLMQAMWPLKLDALKGKKRSETWAESDRHFVWSSSVYAETRRVLEKLDTQHKALAELEETHTVLLKNAQKQLDGINATKDGLLQKRLQFAQNLRKIRAKRLSHEEELSSVISAISTMNYRIKALTGGNIKAQKGLLPSPVSGKRLSSRQLSHDRLEAAPGRHGLSFRTVDGAPVNAIFAGRVVHNNILRGYGRVVILSHGDQYYSLYAFLSESNVAVGQNLQQGQTLGWTGTYPAVDGPGLYFELRFGQKAINPDKWLTLRR